MLCPMDPNNIQGANFLDLPNISISETVRDMKSVELYKRCISPLSRLGQEPFLDRLVAGNENRILYHNVTKKRTVDR